jgi:hypothetical protein
MSMLYMPKPLPLSDLELWVKPGSKRYEYDGFVSHKDRAYVIQREGKGSVVAVSSTHCYSLGSEQRGAAGFEFDCQLRLLLEDCLDGRWRPSIFWHSV